MQFQERIVKFVSRVCNFKGVGIGSEQSVEEVVGTGVPVPAVLGSSELPGNARRSRWL